MPVVFIHTNDRQMIAARVAAHSLKSRSKSPDRFEVRLLRFEETPALQRRVGQRYRWWTESAPAEFRRRDLQSFAPLRRLVPELMGFKGRALVLDPDVFAVGDVYELLTRDMDGKAILCCRNPLWRNGRQLRSSAVMLLDCARLRHWDWERDIEQIFRGRLELGAWLGLLDESPEFIGDLEQEWNHRDTLTAQTKLLHNTEMRTQPWNTGLRADYTQYAPRWPAPVRDLAHLVRRLLSPGRQPATRYLPHPDPSQERLFFTLLKECVSEGSITRSALRQAMRHRYLRADALQVLDSLS